MLVELLLVLLGGLAVRLQHSHPALLRFYVDNSLSSASSASSASSVSSASSASSASSHHHHPLGASSSFSSSARAFLSAWAPLFRSHLLLWAATLGAAHVLLYVVLPRLTGRLVKYKLNQKYPPFRLCCVEALRSVRGLAIAATIELAIVHGYRRDVFPLVQIFGAGGGPLALVPAHPAHPAADAADAANAANAANALDAGTVPLLPIVLGGLLLSVVEETHFYWSHRMLHAVPFLYRHVHKDHHQSFNPDPLSGLSMHWFESAVYFSAAACVACVAPQVWLARLAVKALVLTPLQGHSGMAPAAARHAGGDSGGGGGFLGPLNVIFDAGIDHYIHHAKFNYNYGGNPLWDILMGTRFPEDKLRAFLEKGGGRGGNEKTRTGGRGGGDAREMEARKQAELVGAKYD
jgi:sterol desaturase/sphingolipid hydroxylase (fatty acid hydroxylase superfamily)